VKDSVEHIRPYLKTGDFGNGFKIDGLEPMIVENLIVDKGKGFYVNLRNIRAYHASNFNIEKIRINTENFNIDAIINIKNVCIKNCVIKF
jgi:hypothetical protein